MQFQLVSNARDFWKWASVRVHVLATGVVAALLLDPPLISDFLDLVPESARPFAVIAWLALGILARVIKIAKPGALEELAGESKGETGNE